MLTCGDVASRASFPTSGVVACGAVPARSEVDPLLDDATRLVVAGSDAALAAVVVRLLRRERLDLAVAFVPGSPSSEAAAVWGLPTDPGAALDLAFDGSPVPAPLIRDDRGGVIAGVHRVGPFTGASFCDEHELVRGDAAGLEVRPDPEADTRTGLGPGGGGVAATVLVRRRLLRPRARTTFGRAATVGIRQGSAAAASRDGVDDPKPLERRSWYRHTENWHLVRP
ncbi:hypothetical protein GCM10023201_37860 [Actinomycetospora corticicola]|uniref:Uncharacterized protein n=1 Tax=Actinomycetospora corticicola TaxID=663602 RepID=A0A7Y9J869_9PSEU|nr:hypothetical protein [Actinomycetospora corticicola]NYD38109.1 hypothetical protein [Actinomycetospora corticicola]